MWFCVLLPTPKILWCFSRLIRFKLIQVANTAFSIWFFPALSPGFPPLSILSSKLMKSYAIS